MDIKDLIDQQIYESGTKDITGVVLNGVLKEMVDAPLIADQQLYKSWALAESMTFSNISYDGDGIIQSANITWPNGETGVVQNVVTDDFGVSKIEYTAPGGYVKVEVTRDGDGNVTDLTVTFI